MSDKPSLRSGFQQKLSNAQTASAKFPKGDDPHYQAFDSHAQDPRRLRFIYYVQNRRKHLIVLYSALTLIESAPEAATPLLTLHAYPYSIHIEGDNLAALEDRLQLEQVSYVQQYQPAKHDAPSAEETCITRIEVFMRGDQTKAAE